MIQDRNPARNSPRVALPSVSACDRFGHERKASNAPRQSSVNNRVSYSKNISPRNRNHDLRMEVNYPGTKTHHCIPQVVQQSNSSPARNNRKAVESSSKKHAELGIFKNRAIEESNIEADLGSFASPQRSKVVSLQQSSTKINVTDLEEGLEGEPGFLQMESSLFQRGADPRSPQFGGSTNSQEASQGPNKQVGEKSIARLL